MLSLVYVSAAAQPFSEAELQALLETSRRNNQRDNITGMLLYRDGDFLQVLEGPEDAVRATYARIGRDRRHGRFIMLDESHIDTRAFNQWAMGFRRVTAAESPEGFVDFFNRRHALSDLVDPRAEAFHFLQGFRRIA
ncbi:MAG: BLUF domain-containing protein [Moraxellaceae bacterium]